MYDDPTPTGVIRGTWRWFPAAVVVTVAVLLLGGGITLVGWQANWWFASHNVTRQAHLVQNNYATQEGYLSAISNDVAQLDGVIAEESGSPDAAALRAQAIGIGNQACLEASYLTGSVPVPAEMQAWINGNCDAGAVSLTSPIRTGKGN